MLHEIGHVKNIPEFLEDVKDRNNHARLMSFGHRAQELRSAGAHHPEGMPMS